MRKILVAEDEATIRELLSLNLKMNDYTVLEAADGKEAVEIFQNEGNDIDVCILDIMMPGMPGDEVCAEIRRINEFVGIIMLTAKTQESDKLASFLYGADDYVTKPFSPSELVARVDALYRRVEMSKRTVKRGAPDEEVFGDFTLNRQKRALYKNGKKIILTEVEYKITEYLLHNPDRIISRSELIEQVWDNDKNVEGKIVDVNIRRIRVKLEDNPSEPSHLITIWGQGYRWA